MRVKIENKDFCIYVETTHVAAVTDLLGHNGLPVVGSAQIVLAGGTVIAVPMSKDTVANVLGQTCERFCVCSSCAPVKPKGLVS